MAKVPKFLAKMISEAQDKYDSIKVLASIPAMKDRVQQAKIELDILNADALAIVLETKTDYSDEQVFQVLSSSLSKNGGLEHLAFAQEIGMNYNSLLYFIKMRDFCLGDAWVNTQDRVMVYMSEGYTDKLAVLRHINTERLAECPSQSI